MSPRKADGPVGVVTDSTACLPAHLVAAADGLLRVVPLNVTVGDETFAEGEGLTSEDVACAQREGVAVSTARPSPSRFVEAYDELVRLGCSAIVSVHASEKLSSTVNSARLGAKECSVPIEVIDAGTLGMALGFGALDGVGRAREGRGLDEVMAAVERTVTSSRTAFYVDSLEPLRRGGRIGRAGAVLGSALAIKPLLQVKDGAIAPLARVRSSQRAVGRLAQWAAVQAEGMDAARRVCAVHASQPSARSDELRAALTPWDPQDGGAVGAGADQAAGADGTAGREAESASAGRWSVGPLEVPLGAVVTAHVGAGALAVVVAETSGPLSL